MKAVVSNRIYMDIDPQAFNALDKALTYKIDSYRSDVAPTMIKNVRKIRNGLVSIPVGRFDLIPEGYEIKDKRVLLPVDFPKFKFDLRQSQQDVYDTIEDNAIINAFVSWGKTFTALAIAAKLGQKTLVVTHTVSLRTQWEKEIKKVFGIEPGIIGSGKYDISPPIVVGNIQTLYKLRGKIEKEFGTLIIDECHHIPANTFSKLVDASYARYKIGLSGTVQRKDGKHVIMPDYFGHTKFTPPKENYMEPTIEVIQTKIRFMDGAKIPWANRINDLVRQEEYGKLICFLAAAYRKQGHKVLLLSDRVYFLKRVKETLGEHCELITGEVPLAEREKKIERVQSGKVDILLGTQSIFSEGISVNPLSCLILATPVSNTPLLTQLVGRVIREYPGKIDPVVVDINLKGKTAEKQAKLRLGHYLQQGYNVFFKDM
ncbi:DEAD/DEAH box helicase [Planktomarina sp.]|uniref:DEAD/DEAH box helicase n=1 Tax=Planktomarina sp. TaxID=2024851 RepID=UPI0032607455